MPLNKKSKSRLLVPLSLVTLLALVNCSHDTKEIESGGGLSKAEIDNAVHAHVDRLKSCHENAVARAKKSVTGAIRVRFVVDRLGKAREIVRESSDLSDPRLEECVFELIRGTEFPPPHGGADVRISYPFVFKEPTRGVIEESFGD